MSGITKFINKAVGYESQDDQKAAAAQTAAAAETAKQTQLASQQAAEQARQKLIINQREADVASAEQSRRSARKRGRGLLTFVDSGPQGVAQGFSSLLGGGA